MLKLGQAILTRISLPFCFSYSFLCTAKRKLLYQTVQPTAVDLMQNKKVEKKMRMIRTLGCSSN